MDSKPHHFCSFRRLEEKDLHYTGAQLLVWTLAHSRKRSLKNSEAVSPHRYLNETKHSPCQARLWQVHPIPIPGTSGGGLPVAQVAAAAQNPVMQIDQKKVPVFHAEPDKDSLTVVNWCARIDGMRDAMDWSNEATYANASAALFGVAQRTATNWAILYKAEHGPTRKRRCSPTSGACRVPDPSSMPCSVSDKEPTPSTTWTNSTPMLSTHSRWSAKYYLCLMPLRKVTTPPSSATPERRRSMKTSSTRCVWLSWHSSFSWNLSQGLGEKPWNNGSKCCIRRWSPEIDSQ